MSDQSQNLIDSWKEIRTIVEVLELDVVKYSRGNTAAGLRTRKGLRELKQRISDFVRDSVSVEREKRETKKSKKGE